MVPHKTTKIRRKTQHEVVQRKTIILSFAKSAFWFLVGAFLGICLFLGFLYIIFQYMYEEKAYRGIEIDGIDISGKTREDIESVLALKNEAIVKNVFVFSLKNTFATISAKTLDAGIDNTLLADQAISIGRSKNAIANIRLILRAYLYGMNLTSAYRYSDQQLKLSLTGLAETITSSPVDAQFEFKAGKIIVFRPAKNGQEIDYEKLNHDILLAIPHMMKNSERTILIPITTKITEPDITNEKAEALGLTELIGSGTSLYKGSIESRAFNIGLSASRLHGTLIPPGETFSFNKAVGDISTLTGYKQAYVIKDGRTILGDGGGVCQVSTTLFRAALNAGLPIVERHSHSYRVSYYELDSPPGLDATIYLPDIDLRFTNETGKYILIQTILDQKGERITFELYGTSDGRQVILTKPIITSQTLPPDPLYQDDPTLPKGTIKQIEHAIAGARASFTRTITKKNVEPVFETFISPYRAWQAVYLVGTKE
ncbi:MAG: VanW family protein [Candidatus Levybacteria bacterium]|nr:VanW family protein [Candidatus Levybacteria bacterium]